MYFTTYLFKMYNSVALVYSQSCAFITTINFRTFLLPQKETPYLLCVTFSIHLHSTPVFSISIDLPRLDLSCK